MIFRNAQMTAAEKVISNLSEAFCSPSAKARPPPMIKMMHQGILTWTVSQSRRRGARRVTNRTQPARVLPGRVDMRGALPSGSVTVRYCSTVFMGVWKGVAMDSLKYR
jgi:hypothetical protein